MTSPEAKFLLDPYLDWTKRQGIPIHEGFAVDLLTAETAPWRRLGDGCNGAFVHLDGRGDWLTSFLLDVPPGGGSAPQRHLYDEVFYGLSGTGSMVMQMSDRDERTFEFGPRSLFAPPLNARYRIVNGSRHDGVRLACVNDLRILMNIFHDEAFFFDNPFAFPERQGEPGLLSESSMSAHACEIPAGRHGRPHCNVADLHMFCIEGAGYTLLWHQGHRDFQRIDWRSGLCFALPENTIYQHFNAGAEPAQHLAVGFGSTRFPIVFARRHGVERNHGSGIQHADQDPRVQALWLEELRKAGVRPEMPHGLSLDSRLA